MIAMEGHRGAHANLRWNDLRLSAKDS